MLLGRIQLVYQPAKRPSFPTMLVGSLLSVPGPEESPDDKLIFMGEYNSNPEKVSAPHQEDPSVRLPLFSMLFSSMRP